MKDFSILGKVPHLIEHIIIDALEVLNLIKRQ